ncbi:MAG: hypothetical protein P8I93_01955 [Crocinitomicaceae bacterium]|nr:hypothetical protein [Crocinitomicaceae bacterium]
MNTILGSLLFLLLTPNLVLSQNGQTEQKNNFGQSNLNDTNTRLLLNKNNVNFGLGYGIIAFNVNSTYQRLKAHEKIYSVWSVGLNYLFVSFFSDDHVLIPSLRYGIMTGVDKKHHFEINLGPQLLVGIYKNKLDFAGEGFDFGFNVGYRKQKPEDSKIFRVGLGYPELLYVGLGFSF